MEQPILTSMLVSILELPMTWMYTLTVFLDIALSVRTNF